MRRPKNNVLVDELIENAFALHSVPKGIEKSKDMVDSGSVVKISILSQLCLPILKHIKARKIQSTTYLLNVLRGFIFRFHSARMNYQQTT